MSKARMNTLKDYMCRMLTFEIVYTVEQAFNEATKQMNVTLSSKDKSKVIHEVITTMWG